MKKKVLFTINTLEQKKAGKVLINLLAAFEPSEYDIDLYIMLGRGDLLSKLPSYVNVLNKTVSERSSVTKKECFLLGIRNGAFFQTLPYIISNFCRMSEKNSVSLPDLMGKTVAKGANRFKTEYDVAIAFSEGAATYYVADYVKAKKKAAWIHENMDADGFFEYLDENAYDKYNHVFAVSEGVKESFLEVHPECMHKTDIFYNLIDPEIIRSLAKEGTAEGFRDKGLRLLTVGRLHSQKAYDVAIQAMTYLRKWHYPIKWYVIGDGPMKIKLQELIDQKKLTDYFILLGAKENPYPYFANCDIYVHATRFEGKSVAIQEAQTLGCAVIVSDVSGNREQVVNGYDGVICDLNGKKLAEAIADMAEDPYIRRRMGNRNLQKDLGYTKKSIEQLFSMIEQ